MASAPFTRDEAQFVTDWCARNRSWSAQARFRVAERAAAVIDTLDGHDFEPEFGEPHAALSDEINHGCESLNIALHDYRTARCWCLPDGSREWKGDRL